VILNALRLAAAVFDSHLLGMMFQQALFWNRPDPAAEEALVKRGFWRKCKRVAAGLPFASELLAAYYCAFDRETPVHVKAALIATLAYFVLPADAIPDFLPALGYTDDAVSLAVTLRLVAAHILPEHREAASAALERLTSES
jgi:uncharacterized membrane protein YkvA (DUF1232 family)